MQLVHDHLHEWNRALPHVALRIERGTLAKRRWRGVADDGAEFGFDLEHPLEDGDVFHQGASAIYVIAQKAEPTLELRIADCGLRKAAEIAWNIGNLHFQIELGEQIIRVADDPALRQLFERQHLKFAAQKSVFHPITGAHSHGHEH